MLIQKGRSDYSGALWAQVEKFVYMKAKTFCKNGIFHCELEDLTQSGYIAMVEAVKTYNPEKGSFLTWLSFYLKTAFISTAIGRSERQRQDPIFKAIDIEREIYEGVTIKETLTGDAPDPEQTSIDSVYNGELRTALCAVMDRALTPREKEILVKHFMDGQTLQECADRYGITTQAVAQSKDAALRKMRKRNRELRAFIDDRTPYYLTVSPSRFNLYHESPVERLANIRAHIAQQYIENHSK